MNTGPTTPWDRPQQHDGPQLLGSDDAESPIVRPVPRAPVTPSPRMRARPSKRLWQLLGAAAVAAVVLLGVVRLVGSSAGDLNVEDAARSVVLVDATACGWAGSGSLVSQDGLILTNSHVATDNGRDVCNLEVGFTDSYDARPTEWYRAIVLADDASVDLSVIQALDHDGSRLVLADRSPIPLSTNEPSLGDQIQTLGYPGIGGDTMTFSSGDYAGSDRIDGDRFYKTTASVNRGLSGGAAFNGSFSLVGVPTALLGGTVECTGDDCTAIGGSLGLIRPIEYARDLLAEAKRLQP